MPRTDPPPSTPSTPDTPDAGPALLYEGPDRDRLHHLVTERLAPHRLTVPDGRRLNSRFTRLHEGRLALHELRYGTDVTVSPGELGDFYNVQLPLSGRGVVTVDGIALPSTRTIAGPGSRISMTWDGEASNHILTIPAPALTRALHTRGLRPRATGPRFDPVLDERNPLTAAWIQLALGFREFLASPLSRRSPLGLRDFEHLLIDGLLDAQPHTPPSGTPTATGPATGGPAALLPALRRAKAFCEEHAHEPVTVADIALAARTTPQSLRQAFRTHLDTTPRAYLRRLRLDRVHHDLLAIAQGRAHGTVTDVAGRWGFTHLGRFSAAYRQSYGRPPSATLRPGP
ncbi:AraC family transcriptional regulator [Kitasatospora sp. NPDC101183]|uniref:AraC family transcriptional regulator n=1 Tax=Kitasatospora sp. NPDC101183 TaxID=3364100 RepID=UPI0038104BAE